MRKLPAKVRRDTDRQAVLRLEGTLRALHGLRTRVPSRFVGWNSNSNVVILEVGLGVIKS